MLKKPIVMSDSRAIVKTGKPKYRHGEKQPVSSSSLRGVMTNDVLHQLEMNWRLNAQKLIKEMGAKYICHPDNFVKRKDGKVYK
jgi:hypothetical protein